MSDPVAEKSGFLRKYMSAHPDTLVAYAKWFGKVTEPIIGAEMTSIDTKSMTLTCALKNGTKKVVVVPIEPPLKGYEDVKPRLLDMKATAQEKLGMIKAPQIASFRFPPEAFRTGLFISAILYLYFAPSDGNSPLWEPAQYMRSAVGSTPLNCVAYILGAAHTFEALYAFTLCRKHTGFFTGAAYVVNTLVFGFPIWQDLRARIQAARIESVMKVQ
ncbi:hypothetical protein H0H92_005713 [Tricholoma furcatifolium]|nr:hypothetical protein H0H92_005713 [Tricholoma furcatifolium]